MTKLFLLGLVCVTFIGEFEKTYSMSSKRMTEQKQIEEVNETEKTAEEKLALEAGKEKEVAVEPLEQPPIFIDKKNIEGIYRELAKNETEKKVRSYSGYIGDYYEVYTGEKLIIEGKDLVSVRLIEFPYMSENKISSSDDKIYFETGYQGDYILEVEESLGNKRKIDVKVRHKYNFTEKQNYDIILNSYSDRDYKTFSASKGLFILSYPNSFEIKELLFMDAELNLELENYEDAKKNIVDIKNIYKLTEQESKRLILLEEQTFEQGSETHKNFLYEHKDIEVFRRKLVGSFNRGDKLETRAVTLLIEEYKENPSPKVAGILGDHYLSVESSGEAIKYLTYAGDYEKIATIYLDERELEIFDETLNKVPLDKREPLLAEKNMILKSMEVERELNLGRKRFESENYQEAILFFNRAKRRDNGIANSLGVELDLGISYYNLFDYEKAIYHLKKVIETKDEYKTLEANYYIAMSYYREEEAEKSLRYFDEIVRDYPETSWAKKSMIYIMRLRKE